MFEGVSIVPEINFIGVVGQSEWSNLVSFVTLTPYLILVELRYVKRRKGQKDDTILPESNQHIYYSEPTQNTHKGQ